MQWPGWCMGQADVPQLRRFIDDSGAEPAQKRLEHKQVSKPDSASPIAAGCRRQVLLGPPRRKRWPLPCGNCDRCLEPQTADATRGQALKKAPLGRGSAPASASAPPHVVDVLLGASTAPAPLPGSPELSVYGIAKDSTRAVAAACCASSRPKACSNPWPEMAKWRLPLGPRGVGGAPAARRNGGWKLPGRRPARSVVRARARPQAMGPSDPIVAGAGPEAWSRARSRSGAGPMPLVLTALKDWRIATGAGAAVPPYVVSHDRTLVECRQASRPPSSGWRDQRASQRQAGAPTGRRCWPVSGRWRRQRCRANRALALVLHALVRRDDQLNACRLGVEPTPRRFLPKSRWIWPATPMRW